MHIFHGFQCIPCHLVSEEMVEAIPDKSTLALNLSLVPVRLQYEWIGEWILDPNKIQPGTKMPSFFIDGQSFAHMMVNQPKNEKIKAWLNAHYPGEVQMRLLSDTRWVIGAMQAFLWNFDAETFLSRFPWTPPPAPATPTEDLSEDFSDDFE